ncbi:NRDE family protein [Microbacterium sp. BWT-B31]|uniref:NRDE family protein n=1 Tax=Microbacterium sp. BWT-B31 TaxID=3232072 RepID=UPI003528B6CF
MCTVILHVPEAPGAPVQVLAIRDEDPHRTWLPLGRSWPDTHPDVVGVRDARAGGAWLAADEATRRLAVLLNRADVTTRPQSEILSRGGVVLDSAEGTSPAADPRTHGFNLVEVTPMSARVITWDGEALRTTDLGPGTHMIAHDDVDDPRTARIARWLPEFQAVPLPAGGQWWMPWLEVLARSTSLAADDDRTIIRDNRPFGYPTLSLLVCAASVSPGGVDLHYAELDEPGVWNPLTLA